MERSAFYLGSRPLERRDQFSIYHLTFLIGHRNRKPVCIEVIPPRGAGGCAAKQIPLGTNQAVGLTASASRTHPLPQGGTDFNTHWLSIAMTNEKCQMRNGKSSSVFYSAEISLAIKNAAPAATLPISVVCSALRSGLIPVKRPLTNPKTNSARRVTIIEMSSAVEALFVAM